MKTRKNQLKNTKTNEMQILNSRKSYFRDKGETAIYAEKFHKGISEHIKAVSTRVEEDGRSRL